MNTVANSGAIPYAKPVHPKAPISFRHHVLPPILGVLMFGSLLGLMNAGWIQAQAEYYWRQPTSQVNSVVAIEKPDANSTEIIIPKINVDAPVQYEPSTIEWKIQLALRNGPDHYGNTTLPGHIGNAVIVGHSSGQPWAPGKYKFVFTLLDKMQNGDKIFLDYKGTRYIYKVYNTKVIEPTDISVLSKSTFPKLTLITCTPVGTSKQRFVVEAKQVYPDPDKALPADNGNQLLTGTLPQ